MLSFHLLGSVFVVTQHRMSCKFRIQGFSIYKNLRFLFLSCVFCLQATLLSKFHEYISSNLCNYMDLLSNYLVLLLISKFCISANLLKMLFRMLLLTESCSSTIILVLFAFKVLLIHYFSYQTRPSHPLFRINVRRAIMYQQ